MAQKVAEYELYKRLKLLGQGAFGKAYLVEFLQDQSIWVIKYMDMTTMCPQEKEETLREAKILELLRHPNIVKFKEVYKTRKGKLCIVMEYADGGDLAKRIKDARGQFFSENQILDWFTQVCLAIKHVHDRKIIHRDLKGQNIFLTKDNRVKLGDFGIARVLKKTVEKAKTMVGTPYYISPEIIEGKSYSQQTDIWSLGVILYELCSLKPPFTAENLHFLALKIVKGQYNPIPNQYSNEMKKLVQTLLQTNPSKRPTIQEILKMPIILNRIKGFLSESVRNSEFSHTILHRQVFEPKTNLNQVKIITKELPCPPELLQKNLKDFSDDIQLPIKQPQKIQPQVKSQPTSFEVNKQNNPNVVQANSQPNQFESKPIMKPPSLQYQQPNKQLPEVKKNVITPPSQNNQNVLLQKQESKEKLISKPNVQQRPQSNYAPIRQQPQQLQKPPVQPGKMQRPQSSAQQQERKIVQKSPMQKQRPSSDYQLNQKDKDFILDKEKQKDKERIEERIKNLKAAEQQKQKDKEMKEQKEREQKEKDLRELKEKLQREQKIKEKQIKEQQMQEQLNREKREKELKEKEQEELQKFQAQIKRDQEIIEQQQKDQEQKLSNIQQKRIQSAKVSGEQEKTINGGQRKKSDIQKQRQKENYDSQKQNVDRMQEKNREMDQMLYELEAIINNVNKAVNKLPEQEEKNYFDLQTQLIKKKITEEDREDDDDEPDANEQKQSCQNQKYKKLSEQEEEALNLLDVNKLQTLRVSLEQNLGKDNFQKAYQILKDQIDNQDLDDIDKKHGANGYLSLLPFLSDKVRKQYVPLLFTYIITGRQPDF